MPINDFTNHKLSWMPNREYLSRPQYISLASLLEDDILSGKLPIGTKLPPQRELADWLDINFTTVTRAYDICRSKGLIYGVTGRGTFVSQYPSTESNASHLIDFGAVQGFPEICSDILVKAARDVLEREYVSHLFSYSEREGNARHRAAGAFLFQKLGLEISTNNIAIFPGVQSAVVATLLSVFKMGESIGVDPYTYSNLISAAAMAHIRLVPIECDNEGMVPNALSKAISQEHIKGVFLMPTCANPTTINISKTRKDELAEIFLKNKIIVMEDESSYTMPIGGTFYSKIPNQTILYSGCNRFISPGLRVAFVAFPDKLRNKLLSALHFLTIKTSALDAEILSELIITGLSDTIINEKQIRAKECNILFNKVFPKEGYNHLNPPFFRTISIPNSKISGAEFEKICIENSIKVCHSDRFAITKNHTQNFLRVSISSTKSTKELVNGLNILQGIINNML